MFGYDRACSVISRRFPVCLGTTNGIHVRIFRVRHNGRVGKLQFLDRLLATPSTPTSSAPAAVVVIASFYKAMVDMLEDYLTLRGISYHRVEKKTQSSSPPPQARVLLMTLARAASGVLPDFQAPGTVLVLHDIVDSRVALQVVQRHGTSDQVRILRLVCRYTVESILDEQLSAQIGAVDNSGVDDGLRSAATDPTPACSPFNGFDTTTTASTAATPPSGPLSPSGDTGKESIDESFWSKLRPLSPSAASDRENPASPSSNAHHRQHRYDLRNPSK